MDSKQANDLMNTYQNQKLCVLEKIAAASRNVVPVLRDHNLVNTAQELDRLLFELDANEQEIHKAVAVDPKGFVEALIVKLGLPPR